MDNLVSLLNDLDKQVEGLMARLDIIGKAQRIELIEQEAAEPTFWNNPEAAQKSMQEMSRLKADIDPWQNLAARISDARELAQLGDPSLVEALDEEVRALQKVVERMAFEAMLSGPYDRDNAFIAIHAGAGGTDSQDWAQILQRMYIRWAEQNGYKIEGIDLSEGEEAGIKSGFDECAWRLRLWLPSK